MVCNFFTANQAKLFINSVINNTTIPDTCFALAFPQDSFSEWADYRSFGLRSAMAYIFVFDLTCYESFTHIKALRDQVSFAMFKKYTTTENGLTILH